MLRTVNQINQETIEATIQATTWTECDNLWKETQPKTDMYRNKVLSKLDGEKVTIKGYLVNRPNPSNYTVALVEIYHNGELKGTVQHVNIYADMLSKAPLNIGGRKVKGQGKYNLAQLSATLKQNILGDVPFSKCQEVEAKGIAYCYRGKWSVGTKRQVEYAKNL